MRTKLMASVAVALMGMGATAFGSATPYEAVKDGMQAITGGAAVPGTGPNDTNQVAETLDSARGTMLAGMVYSVSIGAGGANGTAFTTAYANAVIADANGTFGGRYSGEEAYGVARAGQEGLAAGGLAAVNAYYTGVASGSFTATYGSTPSPVGGLPNNATGAHIAYVASGISDITAPDTLGIFGLSHHVLASNIVGAGTAGDYQSGLLIALGNLNVNGVNGSDTLNRANNLEVSTTQALATALWALKTTGAATNVALGGTGDFAGSTLDDLKADLLTQITSNTFYQHWDDTVAITGDLAAAGYAEDLAYGILALKAFGEDASTVADLEARLAAAMNAVGAGVAYNIDVASGVSAQYTGAALQALPEPATLSLLALGGLGLLARRRRQA